jgi:hypothetical protein
VLIIRVACQTIFLTILGLWLLSSSGANAQMCRITAPRYSLQDDIVSWSIAIVNGRSCIRGVRFANVQLNGLKLISPPKFGEVVLPGSGFLYSPKADFRGRDAFSLLVIGAINGKPPGSSTIQVTVSDDTSASFSSDTTSSSDTSPPSVAFITPQEGATISGAHVVLAATASDDIAVENVRYFLTGTKIGLTVTSPPYETTWDSTTVRDGLYTIVVVAQDTSGNSENSWVHVIVKNQ